MILTPEQLALRKKGISGTQIGALAGLSPFATAIDVYVDKQDGRQPIEENFHMKRGKHLETGIVSWYEENTGRHVEKSGEDQETLQSKKHPLVIATPDGLSAQGRHWKRDRILEVKVPYWRSAMAWGEDGTDDIPDYIVPQVQWEMATADLPDADVVAFIDGDIRIYPIPFDPDLFGSLLDIAEKFWSDHVLKGVPPEPDSTDNYSAYLRKQFPRSIQAEVLESTPEVEEWALAFGEFKALETDAKSRKQLMRQNIEAFIGSASGVRGDWGSVSFKNNKDSKAIDYKRLAASLELSDEQLDVFSKIKPGPRVFRVTIKDDK